MHRVGTKRRAGTRARRRRTAVQQHLRTRMRSGALCATLASAALLLLLLASVSARPISPTRFHTVGRADATERVRVHLYLKHDNRAALEAKVMEVSNPDHPSYGKYLSVEEIAALVAMPTERLHAVLAWLHQHGVPDRNVHVSPYRDSIKFTVPVSLAERMFDTTLMAFEHPDMAARVVRSVSRHARIPTVIAKHVELVQGIWDLPAPMRPRRAASQARMEGHLANRAHATQPGVPEILVPRGGDGVLSVLFHAVCKSGSVSTTVPPCSNDGPVVTAINIAAASALRSYGAQVAPSCAKRATGDVACTVRLPVDEYTPVTTLTLQQVFSDGSTGGVASFPYPVVASPMVTPRTLAALYNVPPSLAVTQMGATQAVVEFEQQYYDDADLQLFLQQMGLAAPSQPVVVVGPNDPSNPGTEALLDIEYIMGVAPGAPTTFWSIAANSTEEIDDILQWAVAMSAAPNPPLVNSISYGMSEGNVDRYLGAGYLARSDAEFMKLALRGITIIIASGDTGAGDLGGPPMGYNDCTVLHPDWPSQSPYVTAVGSTYITPYAEPICYLPASSGGIDCSHQPLGEVGVSVDMGTGGDGWRLGGASVPRTALVRFLTRSGTGMRWTSGGGFSNVTPRPSYQDAAVGAYFNSTAAFPPSGVWNPSGRAYPDVSAVGHNLWVAQSGSFIPVDGTSASAPIFAGLVTLLNNERLAAGKSPLGFLNPLLYKLAAERPGAFNDVVVGRNQCGALETTPVCCDFGYSAAPGFDAVGGLGTPNFAVLREAVLQLP